MLSNVCFCGMQCEHSRLLAALLPLAMHAVEQVKIMFHHNGSDKLMMCM